MSSWWLAAFTFALFTSCWLPRVSSVQLLENEQDVERLTAQCVVPNTPTVNAYGGGPFASLYSDWINPPGTESTTLSPVAFLPLRRQSCASALKNMKADRSFEPVQLLKDLEYDAKHLLMAYARLEKVYLQAQRNVSEVKAYKNLDSAYLFRPKDGSFSEFEKVANPSHPMHGDVLLEDDGQALIAYMKWVRKTDEKVKDIFADVDLESRWRYVRDKLRFFKTLNHCGASEVDAMSIRAFQSLNTHYREAVAYDLKVAETLLQYPAAVMAGYLHIAECQSVLALSSKRLVSTAGSVAEQGDRATKRVQNMHHVMSIAEDAVGVLMQTDMGRMTAHLALLPMLCHSFGKSIRQAWWARPGSAPLLNLVYSSLMPLKPAVGTFDGVGGVLLRAAAGIANRYPVNPVTLLSSVFFDSETDRKFVERYSRLNQTDLLAHLSIKDKDFNGNVINVIGTTMSEAVGEATSAVVDAMNAPSGWTESVENYRRAALGKPVLQGIVTPPAQFMAGLNLVAVAFTSTVALREMSLENLVFRGMKNTVELLEHGKALVLRKTAGNLLKSAGVVGSVIGAYYAWAAVFQEQTLFHLAGGGSTMDTMQAWGNLLAAVGTTATLVKTVGAFLFASSKMLAVLGPVGIIASITGLVAGVLIPMLMDYFHVSDCRTFASLYGFEAPNERNVLQVYWDMGSSHVTCAAVKAEVPGLSSSLYIQQVIKYADDDDAKAKYYMHKIASCAAYEQVRGDALVASGKRSDQAHACIGAGFVGWPMRFSKPLEEWFGDVRTEYWHYALVGSLAACDSKFLGTFDSGLELPFRASAFLAKHFPQRLNALSPKAITVLSASLLEERPSEFVSLWKKIRAPLRVSALSCYISLRIDKQKGSWFSNLFTTDEVHDIPIYSLAWIALYKQQWSDFVATIPREMGFVKYSVKVPSKFKHFLSCNLASSDHRVGVLTQMTDGSFPVDVKDANGNKIQIDWKR
eukprot:TRINITY_DN16267_c0_g1_i1.p1 TRINITY_DN16267_c0_g1~~TRINITY_DN16267_c0_g1_i1.p1  ORF type:complete len:972 (+),score=89.62 TRINITY_DN16267_c0_g1_i1:175-3090(+)